MRIRCSARLPKKPLVRCERVSCNWNERLKPNDISRVLDRARDHVFRLPRETVYPVGNAFAAAGVPFNQATKTRWGGTVGTGVDISFAQDWSIGFEYDHLFMGNRNVTFPATAIAVTRSDNIRQDVDMGTVRVNYRFGGPVISKY